MKVLLRWFIINSAVVGAFSAFALRTTFADTASTTSGSNPDKEKCGSMESAREAYRKGDYIKALKTLNCIKKDHPHDLDVMRLFSDILYWQGVGEMGRAEAAEALAISDLYPDFDPFDERRLHFIDRLSNLKIDGNLSLIEDDNSSGTDGSLQGDYRYSDLGHVSLGAFHLSRIYVGDVEVSDWHFAIGHVLNLTPAFYLANSFEYSPTAIISAKWAASITPHVVFRNDTDVSFEFCINSYTTNTVYQMSPAWTKGLTDDWSTGLQVYALFTYHWLFAGQGFLEHQFDSRISSRITVADGKAVEGPGLEDSFQSAALSVGFKVLPNLSLVPNGGIYRADLRNENYIGLGFEWKL